MDYSLAAEIKAAFGVEPKSYPASEQVVGKCTNAYKGSPAWLDEEDEIGTVSFAKTLCEEIARLTFLGTSVKFSGAKGDYMQKIIDKNYYNLRTWCEYGWAYGTVMIKPNGKDYDVYLPNEYYITEVFNREVWGAVFVDTRENPDEEREGQKVWYTRLEYHRFEDGVYRITNKCYRGSGKYTISEPVAIAETPWADMQEDTPLENIERPLFAVLRTPQANQYDTDSPVGLPIFAGALEEIKDFDVAYSRFAQEIAESKRTVAIDSDRLLLNNESIKDKKVRIKNYDKARESMGLPKFVKALEGNGEGDVYHEIQPSINTPVRVQGMNYLLSQIGYKVGFANGYFVFNEQMGIQTATGVEANQQRTIQFIKDCRDRAEKAIDDLVYAIAQFGDMYDEDAPAGDYEVQYQFGDITYNEDEDRARWLTYVTMGKMPFWRYLVKFEGMTEDEAKGIEAEMQAQQMAMMQMNGMGDEFPTEE